MTRKRYRRRKENTKGQEERGTPAMKTDERDARTWLKQKSSAFLKRRLK
jgi:hypothetical protein